MQNEIEKHIQPWAGVWTWHTSHQLDRDRFFEALESLHKSVGGDILRDEFEDALKRVTSTTSNMMDGPQSEEVFDRITDEAIGVLKYLDFKDRCST